MEGDPKQVVPDGFWGSQTPPRIMQLHCCEEKAQTVAGVLHLIPCEPYAEEFEIEQFQLVCGEGCANLLCVSSLCRWLPLLVCFVLECIRNVLFYPSERVSFECFTDSEDYSSQAFLYRQIEIANVGAQWFYSQVCVRFCTYFSCSNQSESKLFTHRI